MNIAQELDRVADRYRRQGYQVTLNPGPESLPPFAKAFRVEILAERPDGNVLVSAKPTVFEFEADYNLPHYADVIDHQAGWRYDVTVLGPPPAPPPRLDADEVPVDQIEVMFEVANRLLDGGFAPQAVVTAWAAFESAMRHRLRAIGEESGLKTSSKGMLHQLFSSGYLNHRDLRDLEPILDLRDIIVHGFAVPEIDPRAIETLSRTARELLAEAEPFVKAS